jgi:putative two-component system response regulator
MKIQRLDKNAQEIRECFFKFAQLAEIHEWDNQKHLERISQYTFLLASTIGLTNDEANVISIASLLHDVGKSFTPIALLKSKGDIQQVDWQIIERHTLEGAKVLESKSSTYLHTASLIALTHHERWDGTGYPQHLKGNDIPIGGRICAIADVYDALTTPRIYKELTGEVEALRLILQGAGILFDPTVVKAFESVFPDIRKVKSSLE